MLRKDDFDFSINEATEEATLRVGEEEFELRFDFAAIYVFYKTFGVNPVLEPVGEDPMRWVTLLWCGLLRDRPDMNPNVVQGWFNSSTFRKLAMGTWQAFLLAMPKPDPEGAAPDPPGA